ncbi:DNA repair protein RecO [Azonexus sp.]|uniref:DNA repair protein RecO n=1 Tax=Azonexus sp. TaxID=1872668 RepID=UPI0027B9E5BA|nr:DNA repair protein RecO [Azonexus sp.]
MNHQRSKVDGQPAFVLHSYPYRETSLIVEVFTRDFGRMALLARGARRPRAAIRGLLMGFQPLELGWAGKGDVLTLMKAEWQGGQPLLAGEALFCGYYLNELLMHLLPREDAHETLFARYTEMLQHLAADASGKLREADLRSFEKALLEELGYGLTLEYDAAGQPISADAFYTYRMEQGPVRLEHAAEAAQVVRGKTLLDLHGENFSDPRSRAEAKALMRTLLAYYLDGKELETRKIFKDLQEL